MNPPIGIAELMKAIERLKPLRDREWQAIASSLGLDVIRGTAPVQSHSSKPESNREIAPSLPSEPPRTSAGEITSVNLGSKGVETAAVNEDFSTSDFVAALKEWPQDESGPQDLLAATQPGWLEVGKQRPNLFDPNWFHAIFSEAIWTKHASNKIDNQEVLDRVCHGLPFESLPHLCRPSVALGLELVLDYSDSMQPFWEDENALLDSVVRWAGKEKVSRSIFEFDPWAREPIAFRWHESRRDSQSMAPLLLVSNLGLGGSTRQCSIWNHPDFAELLWDAKNKNRMTIALVPNALSEIPQKAKRFFNFLIEWDRVTSPQTVRSARMRATQ